MDVKRCKVLKVNSKSEVSLIILEIVKLKNWIVLFNFVIKEGWGIVDNRKRRVMIVVFFRWLVSLELRL